MTANRIAKMSSQVIEIELKHAWIEVEGCLRHDIQPSARLSNYIAALTAEQARRAR